MSPQLSEEGAGGRDRLAYFQALVLAEPPARGDVAGMVGGLRRLCGAVVRAVPAAGAGLSVITEAGVRGVAAASDETSGRIDELQFSLGEGPCMDAFISRRSVLEPDLGREGPARWPAYSAAAYEEGVRAVFAFPLQVGAARLGVLDLYRERTGSLTAAELARAATFADVGMTMLLDAQEQAAPGAAPEGLDAALEYRFELHQAQGMVMVQIGGSLTEALAVLRAYAYSHDRNLTEVARDVVARTLRLDLDPA